MLKGGDHQGDHLGFQQQEGEETNGKKKWKYIVSTPNTTIMREVVAIFTVYGGTKQGNVTMHCLRCGCGKDSFELSQHFSTPQTEKSLYNIFWNLYNNHNRKCSPTVKNF